MTLEETLAQPGFEGAKWVCSPPRAADDDPHRPTATPTTGDLWKGLRMNELADRVDRPLPVLLQGPEGARPRRLLEDPERHGRRRAPHGADLPGRRRRRARSSAGSRRAAPRRRACSACTRRRASSPRAPTPTSSSGTRTRKTKIGINDKHHMNMDHSSWEGWVIDGKVDTVLSRGTVVIEKRPVRRHARATASSSSAACRSTSCVNPGRSMGQAHSAPTQSDDDWFVRQRDV